MTNPYYIKVAPAAARDIKELPKKYRKQIFKVSEALAINPRPPGAKKIDGMAGLYCETINQMRLIYKIEDQEILILKIN